MIRIYVISVLTATLIAVIICLCISLSKPKESFIGDDPPTSGDVLLADDKGSLTTYPLKDLISSIESSVTTLSAQVQNIQSELDNKMTLGQTVAIQSYVAYEPNIPTDPPAPTWLENDNGNAVLSVENPRGAHYYDRTWIIIPQKIP